jgi:hypothetical protein
MFITAKKARKVTQISQKEVLKNEYKKVTSLIKHEFTPKIKEVAKIGYNDITIKVLEDSSIKEKLHSELEKRGFEVEICNDNNFYVVW